MCARSRSLTSILNVLLIVSRSLVDFVCICVYFYFFLFPHRISAIRFVSAWFFPVCVYCVYIFHHFFLPIIFCVLRFFSLSPRCFQMHFDKCFRLYVILPSTIFRITVDLHFDTLAMAMATFILLSPQAN